MTAPKVKTLADFRNTHNADVVQRARIDSALKALLAQGKEAWEYELDFAKFAGISSVTVARYRETYAAHVVEAPSVSGVAKHKRLRYVWVADVKVAARMREEILRG